MKSTICGQRATPEAVYLRLCKKLNFGPLLLSLCGLLLDLCCQLLVFNGQQLGFYGQLLVLGGQQCHLCLLLLDMCAPLLNVCAQLTNVCCQLVNLWALLFGFVCSTLECVLFTFGFASSTIFFHRNCLHRISVTYFCMSMVSVCISVVCFCISGVCFHGRNRSTSGGGDSLIVACLFGIGTCCPAISKLPIK
jgi:hypothetical protein